MRPAAAGLLLALAAACSASGKGGADAGAVADAAMTASAPDVTPDLAVPGVHIADGCKGPWRLSETGLYVDIARQVVSPDALPFEPSYRLWSDGADKQRWVQLPAGGRIDTGDMNHWQFPVGTRFWKQFSLGGKRLETRVVARTGPGPDDYCMGAFIWRDDGSDADFSEQGRDDVGGTDHDVPSAMKCIDCHNGEPGRVLGFSAVQLSRLQEPNLVSLVRAGWLTQPPPPGADYSPPGEGNVRAALGYLHANCGTCHAHGTITYRDTTQVLRLAVEDRRPEATEVYRTVVGVHVDRLTNKGYDLRVAPGDPDASAIFHWMSTRGDKVGMPPLATEHTDPDGMAIVRAWIAGL